MTLAISFIIILAGAVTALWRLTRENKEQKERDAYTERVYRELGFEEKFERMNRGRSERSEDWGDNGRWV